MISIADASERLAALTLLFEHLEDSVRAHRIAQVLDLVRMGEIDPRGLLVARHNGGVVGAVACLPMPGASAVVWPPRGDEQTYSQLLETGLAWVRERGIKLAVSIVAESEASSLVPLADHGFVAAGPMHFLRHNLNDDKFIALGYKVDLHPMTEVDPDIVSRTIERSYQGTLDFPEMAGVRSMEDVVSAYRTNPVIRPAHCRVAMVDGEAAGIALLGEVNVLEGWELNYLGVVPQMRRRGVGKALVEECLHIVAEAGGTHLDVAVDARNAPAIQLYSGLGFQLLESQPVSLRIFTKTA